MKLINDPGGVRDWFEGQIIHVLLEKYLAVIMFKTASVRGLLYPNHVVSRMPYGPRLGGFFIGDQVKCQALSFFLCPCASA